MGDSDQGGNRRAGRGRVGLPLLMLGAVAGGGPALSTLASSRNRPGRWVRAEAGVSAGRDAAPPGETSQPRRRSGAFGTFTSGRSVSRERLSAVPRPGEIERRVDAFLEQLGVDRDRQERRGLLSGVASGGRDDGIPSQASPYFIGRARHSGVCVPGPPNQHCTNYSTFAPGVCIGWSTTFSSACSSNGAACTTDADCTDLDTLPPTFENGTPSVSSTTLSRTTLTVRLDEIGTAYYVVVADGDGAPSNGQVKAGQDSGGSAAIVSGTITISSASQDFTDDITGLDPGTAYDIYVVAEDDEDPANLQAGATRVDVTTNSPDSDGDLTSAGGVTEPVALPTTVDTVGEAVDVFDFTLSDGGTSDGLAMAVSQIVVHVAGTASDTVRDQVTWRLDGNDASNVTGAYDAGADTLTFSGLSISVADAASETYTVNAYYNDNSGLTEDQTLILSVDGDTDLTVGGSGTQMGGAGAVTNGAGSSVDVTATRLAFTTQPAGSTSGSALSGQPVVAAQDAFGNTDVDFTETITLTESGAGTLSGDVDIAAVNGVATFADVTYTATADGESFTLTANDEDDTGADLWTEDANPVTADVVATKLTFSTQPSPTTLRSGQPTSFTTVPVVQAVDADNILDTGYATDIVLSVTDPNDGTVDGTVDSLTGTGDADGDGTTVTLAPSSGAATFASLTLQYTTGGESDTLALRATSGPLTAANSTDVTASTVGVTVSPTAGLTTGEGGASDTFTVVLDGAPTADVTIPVSSGDTGESTVSPSSLTFTPGNWSSPQTVTVTGVDDALDDGDIAYTVVVGDPVSDDAAYDALADGDTADVFVTNSDNDDDNDGIGTGTEDGVPDPDGGGTGDGNGDGVQDSIQSHVASLETGEGDGYATVANGDADSGHTLSDVTAGTPEHAVPAGVTFPYGQVSFTVKGVGAGGSVTMDLYFPYDDTITDYYKWDHDAGEWASVSPTISHVPAGAPTKTRLTFTLTDGDRFDGDGAADGDIDDPGGPVRRALAIPALSPWALLLLAGLMALFGAGAAPRWRGHRRG